jgi:hypothetical protein
MMNKLFSTVAATVALVAPAPAQQQTSINVDGKNYTVTEYPQGRFAPTHMVQLSGPDGTAMISVDKNNKITAIISPPGGQYNGVDYRPVINQVWDALQAQRSGNAANAAPAGGAPAGQQSSSDAQTDALRAQADALTQQALARAGQVTNPASSQPRTVKNLTADGAIVNDPNLGPVTVSDNGMKFEWTVADRFNRAPPAHFTVSFKGGEKEAGAGAKAGKLFKGLGTAVVNSENTHADAASSITTNTDVWQEVSQEGKTKRLVYESGGQRVGDGIIDRDPFANKAQGDMYSVLQDLDVAKDAIAKAQQAGQQISFDTTTDRFNRGYKALQDATKDFRPH